MPKPAGGLDKIAPNGDRLHFSVETPQHPPASGPVDADQIGRTGMMHRPDAIAPRVIQCGEQGGGDELTSERRIPGQRQIAVVVLTVLDDAEQPPGG